METDEGIVGLGEMGGGGESAEMAIRNLEPYLIGHNPLHLESLKFKIANPTASLYNNRTQLLAAIEFACLDIIGKKFDVPVYDLLGGKLRDDVGFASYLFFRYGVGASREHEVRTSDQLVAHALDLKKRYGFTTHKLKGGVFHSDYEQLLYLDLAEAMPGDSFRYDPNGALSVEQSIRFGKAIEHVRNDYFEDPAWGMNGMRRVRESVGIPTATNTVVVNFEQLSANILSPAIDVILLDTTFWGGIRPCIKAATVCETFQIGVSVHSSGELGIQLATMLHLGAVLPNLIFDSDAHYHHLTDDIVEGGKFEYRNGRIRVPDGPGLGVSLDRDKLETYSARYQELKGYPYDRDPGRPDWFPLIPNDRWADPADDTQPELDV